MKMLRSSNITDEDTTNNNTINILESDTKKGETTNSCNKCNKLYELLRHKDQKNKKRFSIGKRRSRWYYPSHGDDLELEGDKVIKTAPEENRRRRTIILYKLNNSWGFTIQSYGIHHRKRDEIELMTYVDHVESGGAAYQAGMRPGDVILSINGKSMEDVHHKDLVQFIKQTGDTMRVVVLFEDCCKKVELHMKYLKLQRTLAEKMFELRSLELQEKRILKGLPQFDCSKSSRSNSTCSLSSSFTETLSLVPELDRCPSPLLSPCSSPKDSQVDGDTALEATSKSKRLLGSSGISKYQSRPGSMIDLSELKRRRRKKRRIIVQSDKRHFQLSPQGGAKSKRLVEKLPPDVEGAAVAVEHLQTINDLDSLQSDLTNLAISDQERDDSSISRSSENGKQPEIYENPLKTNVERNRKENKMPRPQSLSELKFSSDSQGHQDRTLTRSIPSLLNKRQDSNGLQIKCLDLLLKQETEREHDNSSCVNSKGNTKFCLRLLPGNNSTESSPDETVLTESSTSSDEFYQTFIEGDLGSPVAPKLNLSTHPILMKSDSEPINIRYSFIGEEMNDSDDIILPSPMYKKEDTSDCFDFESVTKPKCLTLKDNLLNECDEPNCADTEQEPIDPSDKSILYDKSQNLENGLNDTSGLSDRDSGVVTELANRDSDVSLMSMDSEASRFSYSELPGIDLSFVNGNNEVTEF